MSALWMEGAPVGGINPEEMVLSAVWDVDGEYTFCLLVPQRIAFTGLRARYYRSVDVLSVAI